MTVKEIYGTDFPVILAPMAGITDLPFRILCKEQGADVMVTEMISAKALFYGNKNTLPLMQTEEEEKPIGVQIFGSEPELMGAMAHKIENKGFSYIDINMGCPVPKVAGNGSGSALMKNPLLAGKIIEKTAKAIQKPLTVKIRKGFDDAHVNAVEMAKIAQESGAAAVAVHGRTREQYYSGTADWDIIAQVKQAVKIPVIGNGDVVDAASALRLFEQTGCDGIMVGRGAQGNPWIFREILAALEDREIPARPNRRELYEMIVRHAQLSCTYKGEYITVREMRKHLAWYTTGLPHAAGLRRQINSMETMEELMEGMKLLLEA